MTSRNKLSNHERNLILIKIFNRLIHNIPNDYFFWLLFCILKFLGPLIIVNNYNNRNGDFINIIRNLVVYKSFEKESNINVYNILSILIYILVSCPIILVFWVYKEKVKQPQAEENLLKLSIKQKYILKIASAFFAIILISSQHIVEILSISVIQTYIYYLNYSPNSVNANLFISSGVYSNIMSFSSNILVANMPALFLNLFFIVVLNVLLFLFIKYSNDITSWTNSRLKMTNSNYLYITIALTGNLQGFHYYDTIFNDDATRIKLIFLIISLLILVYPCVNLLIDLIYKSFVGKLIMILQLICIISGITNIIFPDLESSIFLIFIKFFFSASLAFIIFNNIEKKSYNKLISRINRNFFEENKKISIKLLLFIIEKLTAEKKIVSNLYFFIDMIYAHKKHCRFKKCGCTKYPLFATVENIELKNSREITEMQYLITEIIENELFGSIISTTSDSYLANKEFCLLHIDFVYNVKKAETLAYYLIDVYTNSFFQPNKQSSSNTFNRNQTPNFYILYKLFEFKKKILKTSFLKKKHRQIKHYVHLNYLYDLDYLKKLIHKNFVNYEKLFRLKQNILNTFLYELKVKKSNFEEHRYDLNQAKLNNKVYVFEDIVALCEILAKDYRNFKKYLKMRYCSKPLRNSEIGYLIFNFFYLFNKKIPYSIKSCINVLDKYDYILALDSVYKEIDIKHPIIIKIDTKMNFNIKYISQKLCDMIDYPKKELIGKDINCLLPEIFNNIHSKIMKNFIFVKKQKKLIIESFIVTKKNHYFPLSFQGNIFPCLDYNLNILINIKPVKAHVNGCFNEYFFILDKGFNTICFSNSFQEKYSLNIEFFKRLRINFCDFFGINNTLLNANFDENIKSIQNNEYASITNDEISSDPNSGFNNDHNNKTNNIVDLINKENSQNDKHSENYFTTVIKISKRRNFIHEAIEKSSKSIKKNSAKNNDVIGQRGKFVEFAIKTEKLIPNIIKIKNAIYEKESDKEIYEKLIDFEKKIMNRITDFKIFEKQKSINNNFGGNTIVKNQKKKGKMDLFTIIFNIESIGNMHYYIVKIIDLEIPSMMSNKIFTDSINLSLNHFQNNLKVLNSNTIVTKETDKTAFLPPERKHSNRAQKEKRKISKFIFYSKGKTSTIKEDSLISFGQANNFNSLFKNFKNTDSNNDNKESSTINSSKRSLTNKNSEYIDQSQMNKYNYNNNNPSKDINNYDGDTREINNIDKIENNQARMNLQNGNDNSIINFQNENYNDFNLQNLSADYNSNNPLVNNSSFFISNSKFLLNQPSNLVDNDQAKRLNFENLHNNIYTKITHSGNATQGNSSNSKLASSGKKIVKNYKTQKVKNIKINQQDQNYKGKFIAFFYLTLFILLVTLICDYPLKISILNFSHKLAEINYYILGIKSEVFATASAIITACTRLDGIDTSSISGFDNTIKKITDIIGQRSNDLNSFTYRFFSYLDEIYYDGISELFTVINKEDKYHFLYSDWTRYERNSTFITQLKYFNYLCSFMKINNDFNTCRVRERFFNKNFIYDYKNPENSVNAIFLTSEEIQQIKDDKDNYSQKVFSEEMLLFYVFENIVTIYKNNLLKLTLISNTILEDYHRDAAKNIIIYNSLNLGLIIVCFVLMIYFIIFKKKKVMLTFLKLFSSKDNDKFFEMKLLTFKEILHSFDQEKCIDYENKKQEIKILEEKVTKGKIEVVEHLKKNNQLIKNKNLKKVKQSFLAMQPHIGLLSSKDKLTLRSHNDLLGNSSVRKLDKEHDIESDIFNNLDIYNTDFLDQVRFDHLDLKIYSFGKIFLIFGGLLLIILNIINLIQNSSKFDEIIKGNLISSNFLERMPKFCELILYYKISIIYKDIFYIKSENKIENTHLNYYNITIDTSKEGMFNSLKDSQFSNIYYQYLIIDANLKHFMNDLKDQKVLENIRTLENNLNTKDFCFYLAKSYTDLDKTYTTNNYKAGFELMNHYAEECKLIGNGINGNPLSGIMNNILVIIKNNYYDFLRSDDKNIKNFIGNSDIMRANLEIEYIFKKIHDSIMLMIKTEIDTMYINTINIEISFSLACIFVYIFYVSVFLIYVVRMLERYNLNLSFTLERFNKALNKH